MTKYRKNTKVVMQVDTDEGGYLIFDSEGGNNDENALREDCDEDEINERAKIDDNRAHWTRADILKLIDAYKEHRELFLSNSVKNSQAWRRVAAEVPGFNTKQCEAKFKYLKSLYRKRKDYMKKNGSGNRVSFDYFDEFDEIYYEEPDIIPAATASSSSIIVEALPSGHAGRTQTFEFASTSIADESQGNPESSTPASGRRAPKRKRTRLEIQLEQFQANMELREQIRERRMDRFLEQQEVCTNRICEMIQKLIDKI